MQTQNPQEEFSKWNNLKIPIAERKKFPQFSEREIWWCSIGKNVGHECDGKNELFERPVLVLKKFNRDTFLGMPIT
ncbi:MAG: hypothetical protein WC045_00185 [Patescibacteria group bacterium]